MKKEFWKSKTLWVATFDFVAIVAAEAFADPQVAEQVKSVSVWALPFLMGLLRLVTTKPVGVE